MTFVNAQAEDSQIFLYKRRYVPVEGHAPWLVSGNASELERIHYEGMDDVILLDFLPKELGFDMNMHILSFAPVPATVISKLTSRNTVPIFFPVRGFITSTITGSR